MSDPFAHIPELSAWLDEADIELLELKGPAGTLRLTRRGEAVFGEPSASGEEPSAETVLLRAPSVGVFLDRHPLRLQPAAPPGAEVQAGEPIGFMRIGALLRVVEAPAHGIVLDALAAHGDVVGYGAPLFAFEPFGSGTEP